MKTAINRVLRDPLLHFVAIAAVLYGAMALSEPSAQEQRTRIVIDAAVQRDLSDTFVSLRGVRPTEADMERLIKRYVDTEALYREALALQLDHGDEMIRSRLIQRLQLMVNSGLIIEDPGEAVLRPWFEERIERYSAPDRVSLELVLMNADAGDARAAADAANAPDADRPGPVQNLAMRPRPQVETMLGAEFVGSLLAGETGRWQAVEAPSGWQIGRVTAFTPGAPATFEARQKDVLDDWREAERRRLARATLDSFVTNYEVVRDPEVRMTADTARTVTQ